MILSGQVFVPRPVAFQYGFHEPNFGINYVHSIFQGVHFDTEQLLRHLKLGNHALKLSVGV